MHQNFNETRGLRAVLHSLADPVNLLTLAIVVVLILFGPSI